MGWFYSESAREKRLQREASGSKKKRKKKKSMLETEGRRATRGFSFLIAVCSLPRHVEVSGWIAAMQEFMSVIFRGAIQARLGPIKRSQ